MSDKALVRRAKAQVAFGGVDISADISKYLQTLTYTDNESDEADDLQIKMDDREGIWLTKWLNVAIQAAAGSPPSAVAGGGSSGNWAVGQAVVVSGRPQISSYGGSPGATVTNHHGSITYLNLGSGIPYPIHVDHLGWFAESQVTGPGGSSSGSGAESSIKGTYLEAAIVRENWNGDGKDLTLNCGSFELDSVSASGPPSSITLKATSLPFKSTMRQTKKSRAWEKIQFSKIAGQIASGNGMKLMYESSQDPLISRAEQVNQSDIAFLQVLCKKYGISLKATANILVLFDQAEYEAKKSIRTIKRGKNGGYEKYKLNTGEADKQYGACHVQYTDPGSGRVIQYTYKVKDADKDSPTLEIRQKVSSVAEAKQLAEKMIRQNTSLAPPGTPRRSSCGRFWRGIDGRSR